jgi:hypothetical protein
MSKRKRIKKKPGRNDMCPCGSGIKYKHCHGRYPNAALTGIPQITRNEINNEFARMEAKRKQLEIQQGLGRNIISGNFQGQCFGSA